MIIHCNQCCEDRSKMCWESIGWVGGVGAQGWAFGQGGISRALTMRRSQASADWEGINFQQRMQHKQVLGKTELLCQHPLCKSVLTVFLVDLVSWRSSSSGFGFMNGASICLLLTYSVENAASQGDRSTAVLLPQAAHNPGSPKQGSLLVLPI